MPIFYEMQEPDGFREQEHELKTRLKESR